MRINEKGEAVPALRSFLGLILASTLWMGCNAFDDAAGGQTAAADPTGHVRFDTPTGATGTTSSGFPPVTSAGGPAPFFPEPPPPPMIDLPVDDSPVLQPDKAPPPIEGGTLRVSADGELAVAADPDRDRIMLVSLVDQRIAHEVALREGDVPGRLVEDGAVRMHVVLRGAGAVATVDLGTGEVVDRTEVCAMPRGIDYHAFNDRVLVACAGGELVELPADGDGATRVRQVERDLQDVVVTDDDRVFVTTFKRAELLELDSGGEILSRNAPHDVFGPFFGPFTEQADAKHFEPAVAWSALRGPEGSVAIVHQRAQTDVVQISHDEDGVSPPDPGRSSGYGGTSFGPDCNAIVQNGVSFMDADGNMKSWPPLPSVVLPVDGAISPDGNWLAIAAAGMSSSNSAMDVLGAQPGAVVVDARMDPPADVCMVPGFDVAGSFIGSGQTIAVDFTPDGRLVVQTREPNLIRVYSDFANCGGSGFCTPEIDVELGGLPMRDTGHDLFHLDAGRGVACASCHPGGGDDGRTWVFSGLGPRRTQLFNMGIKGTEPLHWDGDMATFDELMGEVFVQRMGGAPQSEPRVAAMADWIEALEPHPPLRDPSDQAAQRGKELFESEDVGCASCHNGELLTNNSSADVGTGGVFQVPSLINVVYHQPYIHTGCAETLTDRFDPDCGGGDQHGKTSHLSADEIDDLVAYLESL